MSFLLRPTIPAVLGELLFGKKRAIVCIRVFFFYGTLALSQSSRARRARHKCASNRCLVSSCVCIYWLNRVEIAIGADLRRWSRSSVNEQQKTMYILDAYTAYLRSSRRLAAKSAHNSVVTGTLGILQATRRSVVLPNISATMIQKYCWRCVLSVAFENRRRILPRNPETFLLERERV